MRALLRRQGMRWGATDEEVHKPLPGDEIVPHPMLETTHAVTIDAYAEEIWPWLVQMGHYRADFYADPSWWDKYSDKYLKSLTSKEAEESGYGFRDTSSAERIVPKFEDLKVGDTILDGPPGTAFFTVRLMGPNRALVLYSVRTCVSWRPSLSGSTSGTASTGSSVGRSTWKGRAKGTPC